MREEDWIVVEEELPDGTVESRWVTRRQHADAARRTEARRLLDVAGSSLTNMRVLTVTCAQDHRLIEVYRIGGVLVWSGGSVRSRRVDRRPNGRHIVRRVDLLDAESTVVRRVVGTCPCGNFSARFEWFTAQVERDDLPAARRVVVPVKGKPEVR